MHIFKKMQFTIFILSITFLLTACGYKPSSYYAKEEVKGNVFVKIDVNLEDPKNSVIIKDSITKILIQKLDSKIVDDPKNADVIMNVAINSVNLQTLQYDSAGYNKLYKAIVVLGINYYKKDDEKRKSFTVEGDHDFTVDDGATITESKRFDAISIASDKALDEILSKIAISSFR